MLASGAVAKDPALKAAAAAEAQRVEGMTDALPKPVRTHRWMATKPIPACDDRCAQPCHRPGVNVAWACQPLVLALLVPGREGVACLRQGVAIRASPLGVVRVSPLRCRLLAQQEASSPAKAI